jgi:hypothetical protein
MFVSIKTQGDDEGGQVSQSIRWLLSAEIVIVGKSVIMFNKRYE